MISINDNAARIVRHMLADSELLGLNVTRLAGGATLVDCGVQATGSLEAGRLFAEACMGGLGKVAFCELDLNGLWLPGVTVTVSQAPLAYATQLAGWLLETDDGLASYKAMGSGPAQALRGTEPIFERLGYRDTASVAVLCLESPALPPEQVAGQVAEACGVSLERVFLLVAAAASLAGAVQVTARVVESGLHKIVTAGLDIDTVLSGFGTCPLPPLVREELQAMGRADNAVLYGGRTC
jgi:methenyltetrahydromethanopterin cyclohydrolase